MPCFETELADTIAETVALARKYGGDKSIITGNVEQWDRVVAALRFAARYGEAVYIARGTLVLDEAAPVPPEAWAAAAERTRTP